MSQVTFQDVKDLRAHYGEQMTVEEMDNVLSLWYDCVEAESQRAYPTPGLDCYPPRTIFTERQERLLRLVHSLEREIESCEELVREYVPLEVLEENLKEKQEELKALQGTKV